MRYPGGKKQIGRYIADIIRPYVSRQYWEPFCGMCSVAYHLDLPDVDVRLTDANENVIGLWKALQNGWIPPDAVTEREYQQARTDESLDPALRAFIGFGCSFAGNFWGGYARSGDRNYAHNARNVLLKFIPRLYRADFGCADYKSSSPKTEEVVYCDPPYANTTNAYGVGDFDSESFWDTVRSWSKHNLVFVSEQQAPGDFRCVWIRTRRLSMGTRRKRNHVEKLFIHEMHTAFGRIKPFWRT